jgi:hypothetical protein
LASKVSTTTPNLVPPAQAQQVFVQSLQHQAIGADWHASPIVLAAARLFVNLCGNATKNDNDEDNKGG